MPLIKTDITNDLVEIKPHGLTLSSDSSHHLMLFKEIGGERVLPLNVSSVEAAAVFGQLNPEKSGSSPHEWTKRFFEIKGYQIKACYFSKKTGAGLTVELRLQNRDVEEVLELSQDSVISLCLYHQVPFFCREKLFNECKTVTTEAAVQIQIAPVGDIAKPKHRYLH